MNLARKAIRRILDLVSHDTGMEENTASLLIYNQHCPE